MWRDRARLHLIDVAVPTAPNGIATYDPPGDALVVAWAKNLAYVADGASGVVGLRVIRALIVVTIAGHFLFFLTGYAFYQLDFEGVRHCLDSKSAPA